MRERGSGRTRRAWVALPVVVASLVLAVVPAAGAADPSPTETAHLYANDAGSGDAFGWAIAVDGDTMVVGAREADNVHGTDAGAAYVFVRSPGSGWTLRAALTAPDGAANDMFGEAVAISGDTILVGAREDDTPAGAEAGSVYEYRLTAGFWMYRDHWFAPDAAAGDYFGDSVAIVGDTAMVGATHDDNANGVDAGALYVVLKVGVSRRV